jgi:hypothetical protein
VNKHTILNTHVIIHVTQRNGAQHEVLVDLDDWIWLKDYTVCVEYYSNRYYASTTDKNNKKIRLHKFIMPGGRVDHINNNGLDCRKDNLRLCTQAQNCQNLKLSIKNRSGVRGVSWDARQGKWQAIVKLNYIANYLGAYSTVEEAAIKVIEFRAKNMSFSKEARDVNSEA